MDRWAGLVVPGLPQLQGGKVLEGLGALVLWFALLALGITRLDRVAGSFFGEADERIALFTLVMVLAGVWLWSYRDARRIGEGAAREGGGSRKTSWGGWEAFRRNRMAVLALGVVVVLYLCMLLTPYLAPFGPEVRSAFQPGGDPAGIMAPPSARHIMGTDNLSQDVFSRILYGSRISLTIGLIAVGISVSLGAFLGAIAGYRGGVMDMAIMRLVDMIMAIPRLVILIAIVALFEPSIFVVIVALAFTQWPFTARMVRGEILALKEREFSEAAQALGFSGSRILFRHLLPNAVGPLIVVATLGVGNAIVLEAGLSFLGLGVEAGTPSWGAMVAAGEDYLEMAWWMATFPGLAIVLAVLSFNLVGDGVRDALDPRQGRGGGS